MACDAVTRNSLPFAICLVFLAFGREFVPIFLSYGLGSGILFPCMKWLGKSPCDSDAVLGALVAFYHQLPKPSPGMNVVEVLELYSYGLHVLLIAFCSLWIELLCVIGIYFSSMKKKTVDSYLQVSIRLLRG